MNLDELADLTRQRTRAPVTVVRDPTLDGFRTYMRMANEPARRIIVNFHRGPLSNKSLQTDPIVR